MRLCLKKVALRNGSQVDLYLMKREYKIMDKHKHASHKGIILRLKKANGHLAKVIHMMEHEESCLSVSQQLYAVEKAITQAKKIIIHEHIEHCLEETDLKKKKTDLSEFKEITKYL